MKIIPQIDTYPRLVELGETMRGRLMLLAAFTLALLLNHVGQWMLVTIIVAAISFLPSRRRLLVSLGALCLLLYHNPWLDWDFISRIMRAEGQRTDWRLTLMVAAVLVGIFCGTATFFQYVSVRRRSFVSRRPVLVLVSAYLAILLAAGSLPLKGTIRILLWTFIALLTPYLWFYAYALQDATSKAPDAFALQFGTFHPFWMIPFVSFTPIAKGASYLRKTEVRTAKEFSIVQLKAVKLLLWITVLSYVLKLFTIFVYGGTWRPLTALAHLTGWSVPSLALPNLSAALRLTADGARVPIHIAWASVFAHFVESLLRVYVSGNIAVACCRMAGFYALRNTYRPLQAVTIAEFWNRYYYYFKELLVEFFFFPTYMRYLKKHRRLRMFTATLAAATFGNIVYHFARDYQYVADRGAQKAVSGFLVYAFYALLLGIGIGLSQLRSRQNHPEVRTHATRRVLASAMVMLFFCMLEIFDDSGRTHPLRVHLTFLFNMFSLAR